MLLIIVVFLFVITVFLFSIFITRNSLSSDQAIHLLFIDLIKKNKHRFISSCDNFLIQKKMVYPQLIHWIFSFIPNRFINVAALFTPLVYALFSLITFLFFILSIYPVLPAYSSKEELLLLAGLLFITTPYNFNITNAKNVGISARGVGLFLGQLYTYSLVLYIVDGSYYYLIISVLSALFIFMSSQFASQYILFITPIFSLFNLSWVLLLPLFISIGVYFLIAPQISYQFFAGNLGHKKFYYKYLADKLLLKYRESIWKDVFWEIWRLIFTKSKPRGSGTLFMYIYSNSFILLLFSLPLALPLSVITLFDVFSEASSISIILGIPIVISVTLFFIFSFKGTRFLGEPERYVEFAIGFMAVYSVFLFKNNLQLLYLLLVYQVCFVFIHALVARLRRKHKTKAVKEKMDYISSSIDVSVKNNEEVRLLSNSTEVMRMLTNICRKVFYPSLYSEWYGKFHYLDLYYDFDHLKENMIAEVIKEHKINIFVLDTNLLSEQQFISIIQKESLIAEQLSRRENLVAYKTC